MPNIDEQEKRPEEILHPQAASPGSERPERSQTGESPPKSPGGETSAEQPSGGSQEGRPIERRTAPTRGGLRGTAAMDPDTRKEVARKGGLAVSRNRQHMAEIGRKGGQSVSKNREHMARIGKKGGAASRGHRGGTTTGT